MILLCSIELWGQTNRHYEAKQILILESFLMIHSHRYKYYLPMAQKVLITFKTYL